MSAVAEAGPADAPAVRISPPRVRALASQLATQGWACAPACLDDEVVVPNLTAEAYAQEEQTVEFHWGPYGLGEDGSYFSGGMSFRSAPSGPWLTWLHTHPDLERLVGAVTGEPLVPSIHRSFQYYTDASFVHVHTDVTACELTLLISLIGQVPPLVAYPKMRGRNAVELMQWADASAGIPPGGREVRIPTRGFLFLRGRDVPHRRPEVRLGSTVALATLCFAPADLDVCA
jgi:hypothetical protein